MNQDTTLQALTEQEIIARLQADEDTSMSVYRDYYRAWVAHLAKLLGQTGSEIYFQDKTMVENDKVINASVTTAQVELPGGMALALSFELARGSKTVFVSADLKQQVVIPSNGTPALLLVDPPVRSIARVTPGQPHKAFDKVAEAIVHVIELAVSAHLAHMQVPYEQAMLAAKRMLELKKLGVPLAALS